MAIHMKGQITRCGSAHPWELAQRVWRDFENQADQRRKRKAAAEAEAVPPGTRVFYEQSTGMNRECLIYAVRHDGSVCLLPVDLEI